MIMVSVPLRGFYAWHIRLALTVRIRVYVHRSPGAIDPVVTMVFFCLVIRWPWISSEVPACHWHTPEGGSRSVPAVHHTVWAQKIHLFGFREFGHHQECVYVGWITPLKVQYSLMTCFVRMSYAGLNRALLGPVSNGAGTHSHFAK